MAKQRFRDEQAFVEHVQQVRQAKILRQLLDRDISLLFEDPLENDMVLNMGPQHPATHGVLRGAAAAGWGDRHQVRAGVGVSASGL
jgi:hypothetical protein